MGRSTGQNAFIQRQRIPVIKMLSDNTDQKSVKNRPKADPLFHQEIDTDDENRDDRHTGSVIQWGMVGYAHAESVPWCKTDVGENR